MCSWYDPGSPTAPAHGYLGDEGHLCLIDSTGRNFINLTPNAADGSMPMTRVFPPAWLSNNEIIFGGRNKYGAAVCYNALCYANLKTGALTYFDTDTNDLGACTNNSSNYADMPIVRDNNLFYRMTCLEDVAGSPEMRQTIRWAKLGTAPNFVDDFEALPGSAPWTHTLVKSSAYIGAISGYVDYYTVSRSGMGIMIYSFNSGFSTYLFAGGDSVTSPYSWSSAGAIHYVDDMVDSPSDAYVAMNFNINNNPSWRFAYRNTIDWVP